MSRTVSVRNQRPSVVRALTKSIDHRSLGRVGAGRGTRVRLASFFRGFVRTRGRVLLPLFCADSGAIFMRLDSKWTCQAASHLSRHLALVVLPDLGGRA